MTVIVTVTVTVTVFVLTIFIGLINAVTIGGDRRIGYMLIH